jgi:hypothetical protein
MLLALGPSRRQHILRYVPDKNGESMSDAVPTLAWKQWQVEVQRLLDTNFGGRAGNLAVRDIDWISWQHAHARGRTPLQAIENARAFMGKLDRLRRSVDRRALRHVPSDRVSTEEPAVSVR